MCLLERSDKKKKSQKTTARRRRRRRVCVWVCMCVSVSVSEIVSSSFLCSSLCICRPRVCGPELGGWVVHWFLFDSLLPDDETSSPKCRNSIRRNVAAFAAEIVPSLSLSLSLFRCKSRSSTHPPPLSSIVRLITGHMDVGSTLCVCILFWPPYIRSKGPVYIPGVRRRYIPSMSGFFTSPSIYALIVRRLKLTRFGGHFFSSLRPFPFSSSTSLIEKAAQIIAL